MGDKTGQNLCDLDLGKYFLDTTPKAQPIKQTHIDELELHQIKVCPLKNTKRCQ